MGIETTTPLAHRIPDACKRLGIGRTSLYELIKNGDIRTIRLAGRTLVPEEDLQKVVAAQLTGRKPQVAA